MAETMEEAAVDAVVDTAVAAGEAAGQAGVAADEARLAAEQAEAARLDAAAATVAFATAEEMGAIMRRVADIEAELATFRERIDSMEKPREEAPKVDNESDGGEKEPEVEDAPPVRRKKYGRI